MHPLRTILYATDFSEPSRCAFPLACALARDYGARLVVLTVVPPPLFHGEVVARRQEGFYEDYWAELLKFKPADPGVAVEYALEKGDVVEAILAQAQQQACDLLVLGTHGRSGLGRLLVGSVAEQVMRKAPCPVLTVRAPLPQAVAEELSASSRQPSAREKPLCFPADG
ncbi:MAG: universal stress protein [Gemmataceae bacterium]|nr:universal stress protein [Gemmataceae bacterium]